MNFGFSMYRKSQSNSHLCDFQMNISNFKTNIKSQFKHEMIEIVNQEITKSILRFD